jgi:Amt family ammonium transporter|tara:strand:- start:8 stop:163 length:156 start_codon:yes stop_codon:yes gene_type:complete
MITPVSGFVGPGGTLIIILKVAALIVSLRVEDDQEVEGLDLVLHNERGYDL